MAPIFYTTAIVVVKIEAVAAFGKKF